MRPAPDRHASRIVSLVLDATYLAASLVSLVVGALRGKLSRRVDHLVRRAFRAPIVSPSVLPRLWIHAVSVGEIMTVRRLVARLAQTRPEWNVVISASTRAGVDAARKHFPRHEVFSAPLDLSALVRRALDRVRPTAIAIVEHDLWPNFVRLARARGIEVALVNARLSPRSLRGYQRLSKLFTWPPRDLLVCVQDHLSAEAFDTLGHRPDRWTITGNLKFDNPPPPADGVRASLGYGDDARIFLAGSTHEGEEALVLDALRRLRDEIPNATLWLVPRRIERAGELVRLIEQRGFTVERWSVSAKRGPDVLLVDVVGELARLSSAGDLVFVGGSLVPIGGHNMIEPASYGRPVIVGPHVFNFTSIVESFRRDDAIRIVANAHSFADDVLELARDDDLRRALGERALRCVEQNIGAVDRTIQALDSLRD